MNESPLLSELLQHLPVLDSRGPLAIPVTGVHHDSRQIEPGHVFVAITGENFDGRQFYPHALEQGAAALVMERPDPASDVFPMPPASVPLIFVENARRALAQLAAAFYRHPSQQLKVIGITGTDGKTTTCHLIYGLLNQAGHHAGLVSTVSARIGNQEIDTGFHVTTPEAQDLQAYLRQMLDRGAEYAVVEVTSHGLAQHRVEGVHVDVAVLTNITHESLEYHRTFAAYRKAKARLFEMLGEMPPKPDIPKVAVLNADDPVYEEFRRLPADLHLSYAIASPADVTASAIQTTPSGLHFTAHTPAGSFEIVSPLLGQYNVYNILAALAVGISQDIPVETLQAGIARVRGVKGRMDLVDEGQDFIALVDFAHTAAALEQALRAARQLTTGRILVVFGCAGLRDVQKRPMMGEIAARLADVTVITAEDPRTEDLLSIMHQIALGARQAGGQEGRDYYLIPDRGEAIRAAVAMAQPGDLVMVCGKGHEASMCFGTIEYPWSDHVALRKALHGEVHQVLPTATFHSE